MYITTEEDLAAFCKRASAYSVLAIDTEFLRERTYHPQFCLIQAATKDEAVAIDPLAISDLSPLCELLVNKGIVKVFHACDQDLEVIYDSLGVFPEPLFDTQLAAAFLGYRMQIGYGALVASLEGVHLKKADSLTDWSQRPLDEEQLRYAEEDVLYLPHMYETMTSELIRRDRLSWVLPELEALCTKARVQRDPREAYVHLKRATTLTRKQLAVAREVCAWREECAARKDIPRKWLLSDELVVEVCRAMPKSVERLQRLRGAKGLGSADARGLLEAVALGDKCPPSRYPSLPHRPKANPESDSVVDLMYAMLRLCSERSDVAIPLIATRDDLRELLAGKKDCALMAGWRYEVAGKRLCALLAGDMGITVSKGHLEFL